MSPPFFHHYTALQPLPVDVPFLHEFLSLFSHLFVGPLFLSSIQMDDSGGLDTATVTRSPGRLSGGSVN